MNKLARTLISMVSVYSFRPCWLVRQHGERIWRSRNPQPRDSRASTSDMRDAAMMRKAGEDQAPVVAMTVPDAIRVCGPLKCVYVEKIEYCAPSSSCGQSVIITNWGTLACPSGYKCFTDAHGRHKTLSSGVSWPADGVGNAVECAVNIGFGVGAGVTKGWGWGAAAGAALAAWGCRNI